MRCMSNSVNDLANDIQDAKVRKALLGLLGWYIPLLPMVSQRQ